MYVDFNTLSDNADLWLYGFDRDLTADEAQTVENVLHQFTEQWLAHNLPVSGSYLLVENRFVALAAEPDSVSGCSIDASVTVLKELKSTYGLDALDQSKIHFRQNGIIQTVSRPEFKALVLNNRIVDETPVFDLTLQQVSDFRNSRFEVPFAESWQAGVWGAAVQA